MFSIREAGEDAVFKTGIGRIHPDLVKLLGRMSLEQVMDKMY